MTKKSIPSINEVRFIIKFFFEYIIFKNFIQCRYGPKLLVIRWDFQSVYGSNITVQKMKFSIKDFFSKSDQIRRKLGIWSHLLKKSLMENFIFCAVYGSLSWTVVVCWSEPVHIGEPVLAFTTQIVIHWGVYHFPEPSHATIWFLIMSGSEPISLIWLASR